MQTPPRKEANFSARSVLAFCFCALYLFATTATNYAPPLCALLGYLLLARLRAKGFDYPALALIILCLFSELLHGLAAFSSLLAVLFVRYLLLERLIYKLAKKELLIAVLVVIFYALILFLDWFLAYSRSLETASFSALFIYYAAAEAALICLFYKEIL